MYIFLGIVGELATVVGSVAISLNGCLLYTSPSPRD